MNSHRLAEAAVGSRHTGPHTRGGDVSGPATPADPIHGHPGPVTGKTRPLRALHRLPDRRHRLVVLDEMPGVEPTSFGPLSSEPLRIGALR